jgi:hypothetical protein
MRTAVPELDQVPDAGRDVLDHATVRQMQPVHRVLDADTRAQGFRREAEADVLTEVAQAHAGAALQTAPRV